MVAHLWRLAGRRLASDGLAIPRRLLDLAETLAAQGHEDVVDRLDVEVDENVLGLVTFMAAGNHLRKGGRLRLQIVVAVARLLLGVEVPAPVALGVVDVGGVSVGANVVAGVDLV
jgi:hypothetical protein